MKSHMILSELAARRRALRLSQDELAQRAGLRREKVNRIESRGDKVNLVELERLLDVVGLELSVAPKKAVRREVMPGPQQANEHGQFARPIKQAAFVDGGSARIVSWGKLPK
jgi:transcriptional regulator with XRE-family HTH domain